MTVLFFLYFISARPQVLSLEILFKHRCRDFNVASPIHSWWFLEPYSSCAHHMWTHMCVHTHKHMYTHPHSGPFPPPPSGHPLCYTVLLIPGWENRSVCLQQSLTEIDSHENRTKRQIEKESGRYFIKCFIKAIAPKLSGFGFRGRAFFLTHNCLIWETWQKFKIVMPMGLKKYPKDQENRCVYVMGKAMIKKL